MHSNKYNHQKIEKKWQKKWAEDGLYKTGEAEDRQRYYILDMFPYPSGAGLHVGHVESYTATDIYSRYMRMRGGNVLHPQGFDAFGLPAENYAVKTGVHPRETTQKAISVFKKQINSLGFSYDWSREVNSSSPEYYKWTQWLFLLFYKNGLAYKKKAKVNWCPKCQTVLANEQAENGKCERCESEVAQKDLEQWFFRITDFIEDKDNTSGLISGLDKIDWPDSTRVLQKNWIGRSEGAEFRMKIKDSNKEISVYTTRIDTVFGMTYAVLAPEHKIISQIKDSVKNFSDIENYIRETKKKTDLERMEAKEKTGVLLEGVKVINPFNNEAVPLFVADYVLAQYGTGAVMAVPAHDERDFAFANKFNLPIKQSVRGGNSSSDINTDDGALVDSGEYSGLSSADAREKMTLWLIQNRLGEKKVNYRIRDWLVSRQRYWGAPIPIIYCEHCGEVPVLEQDLPVELPTDVDFKPTGESPLKYSKTFHDAVCPNCGAKARRESDTMDTFVCSSWYYLRYSDPKNDKEFASKENLKKWLPVDLYVGGAEHSVLHLLYSRFFTKALHHLGYLEFDEPFLKLRHQGIILAEDGTKMSKSKGNVVNPDDVVQEFGADSLRLFEMFMGPLEDMKPWNTKGIVGISRFLEKIFKFQFRITDDEQKNNEVYRLLHKTIKKVGEDIEGFKFNTAISAMMILLNAMEKEKEISREIYEKLLIILAPFAPHLCEEIWSGLGNKESICLQAWPEYDSELAKDEKIQLVLQVNGKVRDTIEVDAEIDEADAKKIALESEKIKKWIEDRQVFKTVYVKGRLVNIAVK